MGETERAGCGLDGLVAKGAAEALLIERDAARADLARVEAERDVLAAKVAALVADYRAAIAACCGERAGQQHCGFDLCPTLLEVVERLQTPPDAPAAP